MAQNGIASKKEELYAYVHFIAYSGEYGLWTTDSLKSEIKLRLHFRVFV